jgi:class 3 adenylate cyclase/tetratricopeptide (TPR) repeat protein
MECPNCGHANAADARFCSNCGHALSIACPVCGTLATPDARFCSNCGSALTTESPAIVAEADLSRYVPEELLAKMRSARAGRAMEGERRTVTMLFADIQGSTAAAERLDPEDWAEIINGAFEHLIAPVYRYEGTLARLQGDAVLAFFGAPIAHEDDPIRAVRAGLEIAEAMHRYRATAEERWGIPIEVRVGINTGLVVVGEVGSDLRVEYTALGDAINVAARMEQTAEPGTVRVTADTLALTDGAFDVEELGGVEVKGKTQPVSAFRVQAFTGLAPIDEAQPIVGRTDELAALEGLRDQVADGSGSIVSVIGEAGVGKSRLLQEFQRRADAATSVAHAAFEDGGLGWMVGMSRSYDRSIPFSTVGDLLRRWWGVDDAADGFTRVEEAVTLAGLEDADAAAYLAYVAGITPSESAAAFIDALETPVLHARAAETLFGYLTAETRRRPTIVVFEDLHWADDLSLALVEGVMDVTESAQLGLVVAMRPYRDDPTWRIHEVADRDHHHRYTSIDLGPLTAADSAALLEALVAGGSLTDEVSERILERSDGNPLFLEQIARAVAESGGELDSSSVPTSLTGMLTARLDRLDDETKYAVQMASVLGTEFDRDTLLSLLGPNGHDEEITELLRKGMLTTTPGGSSRLAFQHALIQETAYSTILRRNRRVLHERVADHLVATRPHSAAEIARHFLDADQPESAFPYLVEAGTTATRSMALADAIRLFSTAVEHVPPDADPELVVAAHDGLGEAYTLVPDLSRSEAAFQRLFDYGERTELPSAKVAALNRIAFATATIGADLERATEYLNQARALAEETGDDLGLAEYHMNACFVASLAGNVAEAVAHDESTVDLGEQQGIDRIRMAGLIRRAINYAALLDFDKARPTIEQALEESRAAGMEEAEATLLTFGTAVLLFAEGHLREALQIADGAQTTLERYASFYAASGQRMIGRMLYLLGDVEGALSRFVDTRRLAERLGQHFAVGVVAADMAQVYASAGMEEPIEGLRATALDLFAAPMGEFMASTGWASLGDTDLLLGRAAAAREDFETGLTASSYTMHNDRPRLLAGLAVAMTMEGDLTGAVDALGRARAHADANHLAVYAPALAQIAGELAIAGGDVERARAELTAAQEGAMASGQLITLINTHASMARLHSAARRDDEAARSLDAARSAIGVVADGIADPELRESFSAAWTARVERAAVPGASS